MPRDQETQVEGYTLAVTNNVEKDIVIEVISHYAKGIIHFY